MDNKFFRKVTSCVLLCSVLAYTAPAFALTKDETVYSNLDTEGRGYKTILSTKADGDYVQSETDKEIPVVCSVRYELDGKEMTSEEICGKKRKGKSYYFLY